jgi:type IV pilus assembly protein PilC
MPLFRYHALDADGKPVSGDLETDGVYQAVTELQARGLRVQSIVPATSTAEPDASAKRPAAPPLRGFYADSVERPVLQSHMATILERGRTILPALRAYADEMPSGWQRRQLSSVCNVLERGDTAQATAALAELPECWIPLLSAATSSPDPGHVLEEFLAESRRADELRQKWWLTLAYPLVLVALATVVMTALSIFVIPEFRTIFREFNLNLPTFTRIILNLDTFLSRWGVVLIVILAALLALLTLNANRLLPESTMMWLRTWLRPPLGRRTAVARFTRFLADLLEAGVSTPDALRISGFTVNQPHVQRAAWQLASDMESTGGFSQNAYQRPLTATVTYALAAETAPSTRVRLLREISNCHEERVRMALSWTTGMIEPLAIVVVGLAVGFTVVALFLPLVKLVEGLSM